jgi:hypothetical protein
LSSSVCEDLNYPFYYSLIIAVNNIVHLSKNDMPSSKKRQHHHQHHNAAQATVPKAASKANERIVTAAVVLFAVVGLGIAYFASEGKTIWIIAGAVIGGIAGYFFGKALKKGLLKG